MKHLPDIQFYVHKRTTHYKIIEQTALVQTYGSSNKISRMNFWTRTRVKLSSLDPSNSHFNRVKIVIMIYIFLAVLEVAWLMIWHPNKANKFPQDPPTNFKPIVHHLVKREFVNKLLQEPKIQSIITLQMLSRPFILATTLAGDKSWTACLTSNTCKYHRKGKHWITCNLESTP